MEMPDATRPRRERRDVEARRRRDELAAWHQVPAVTFAAMPPAVLDTALSAIRGTPSRWAGVAPTQCGPPADG